MAHVDWTRAAEIAAPSAVAALAIVAGWRQNVASLRAQRRAADVGEVRAVFDQAAVLLHDLAYDFDALKLRMHPEALQNETGAALVSSMETHGQQADVLRERLRVRLGREHDVVVAFDQANAAALDIFRAAALLQHEPPATTRAAAHQVHELREQTVERVTASRARFDAARESFIDAAQRSAGSDL